MERVVSATEARVHFGELMRQVVEGKTAVIVERSGRPEVVVISLDEYKRLRSGQRVREGREPWEELLDEAHAAIRASLGDRTLPAPEDVIREMRAERDEHLLDLR